MQSKFDYCDVIWGNLGKVFTDQLQNLQNRALRCVLNVDWRFSTELLYSKLNVKTLVTRRNERTLHVMYKIAHGLLPENTCNQFSFNPTTYNLRRSYLKLKLPVIKNNYKKRSLQYRGAKQWNALSDDTKALSFNAFKQKIGSVRS